jgi:hypothetical protein
MQRSLFFLFTLHFYGLHAQLPNHPPIYTMNKSTIIMPCNKSSFLASGLRDSPARNLTLTQTIPLNPTN